MSLEQPDIVDQDIYRWAGGFSQNSFAILPCTQPSLPDIEDCISTAWSAGNNSYAQ
ncbi:MAG: hypothetical protein AMXMBFR75_27850 [Candidatus Hinthialibacteria bacterium]